MNVPLELSFRNVTSSVAIEDLIQRQTEKLARVCEHLTSCRVAIERPHARPSSGTIWRVRLELHVPPGHELAVVHEGLDGDAHESLPHAIRDAYDRARRAVKRLKQQQRGEVKRHPAQQLAGVVEQVLDGYGFIRTVDGRQIYFHENAVLEAAFDALVPGMGVAYEEEPGDEGPQASTVRVVDHRGGRTESESRHAARP